MARWTADPSGGAPHRAGATQRWARAAFPPGPARGQSAGTCPSDSRAPWTPKGGSPGAGPQ
eukprot:8152034-Alexandrium_andersonii.AAC.1